MTTLPDGAARSAGPPGGPLPKRRLGRSAVEVTELSFGGAALGSCKLSGLVTQAAPGALSQAFVPAADVVLRFFGARRVTFGSDWPVCLLASDYAGQETVRGMGSGSWR